jgi:glutamine synthetase
MGAERLTPISAYNEDYNLFQTSKEEPLMRALRNGLYGAGIPVENSKGEAEAGQAEINIRYADMMQTADFHVITKQATKEIAHGLGKSVTFMAKYDHRARDRRAMCINRSGRWTASPPFWTGARNMACRR